jgi:cytochrome c5
MNGRTASMFGAAALLAASALAPARAAADGKEAFVSLKCTTCHSISAAGVESKKAKPKGGDLSKVGGERDAQWIQDLLAGKVKTDKDKKHPKYKGTPEQAKTIADWLATLK